MFLDDVRILDLTEHRGEIGPWLLGWLGADVIRVEPPGGSTARQARPHRTGGADDLRSLQFAAFNDGKRSIAVDLAHDAGRSELLDLVAGADIVFESGPPGAIAEAGLTEADLVTANDRLVHVLVTPFGSDGPRVDQPASELTLAALGGPMSLQGVRERAPVKVSVPQVWRHTGTEAAVGAMIALRRMEATGEPQWVDVSAQAAMTSGKRVSIRISKRPWRIVRRRRRETCMLSSSITARGSGLHQPIGSSSPSAARAPDVEPLACKVAQSASLALATVSVREARHLSVPYAFEVISPQTTITLQARSHAPMLPRPSRRTGSTGTRRSSPPCPSRPAPT